LETDILVGLRFELSGGVGKMSGDIVGRAGDLYLVQRHGAEHLELLELSDLRSARFYGHPPRESQPRSATTTLGPVTADTSSSGTAKSAQSPRLFDKIRRSAQAAGHDDATGG